MESHKSIPIPSFWSCYDALPSEIQKLADKQFRLFLEDHIILRWASGEKVKFTQSRLGVPIALSLVRTATSYYWFWIGSHEAYNKLLRRVK